MLNSYTSLLHSIRSTTYISRSQDVWNFNSFISSSKSYRNLGWYNSGGILTSFPFMAHPINSTILSLYSIISCCFIISNLQDYLVDVLYHSMNLTTDSKTDSILEILDSPLNWVSSFTKILQ